LPQEGVLAWGDVALVEPVFRGTTLSTGITPQSSTPPWPKGLDYKVTRPRSLTATMRSIYGNNTPSTTRRHKHAMDHWGGAGSNVASQLHTGSEEPTKPAPLGGRL
jgi:hypothetical protein